jgi:hypothetical protein
VMEMPKTKAEVLALLGEPDRIYPPGMGPRMLSTYWFCCGCAKLHTFPEPVECPAPCECGGITFEKRKAPSADGGDK